MDIFVRGVPVQTTESALLDYFKPIMERFSIHKFHCTKLRSKPFALLTVADVAKAKLFLKNFGQATRVAGGESLFCFNTRLLVTESRNQPNEIALRALRYEEEALQRRASRGTQPAPANQTASYKPNPHQDKRKFDISCFECGTWNCNRRDTSFESHFWDKRQGSVVFGKKALAVILRMDNQVAFTSRIDIPYWSIDTILTCPQTNAVTFTLMFAPRIYRTEDNTVEKLFSDLGLISRRQTNDRARVSAIDDEHKAVVGSCFVYRITLANPKDTSKVHHLVYTNRGMPSVLSLTTSYGCSPRGFELHFQHLIDHLRPGCKYGQFAFSMRFQVERLTRNGYLPPDKIIPLLPAIQHLSRLEGIIPTTVAIERLSRKLPLPVPYIESENLEDGFLAKTLAQYAQEFEFEGSIYDSDSWNNNQCALVHRAVITPAGTYLEGPEPEAGNRVLRQYRDYADHFLRVEFTDEDGDYVRFEPRTDLSEMFSKRFKGVLDSTIDIGGRSFEFLGFSHSSLRQKTCWFLSPITIRDTRVTAEDVIKDLGDFSGIRCPAKCAARIGQAFSETTATVAISQDTLEPAHDVVRNGRTFSDGVGTISSTLLRRVWKHYGQARGRNPTCLQIRFAGAKGMVSLDNRLQGERLVLRPSMVKFYGSNTWDIEVCGANFKPLPMYLNRQLVKILEDLGVPAENFLALEEQMIEQIRRIPRSPLNAAIFLETARVGLSTRMPFLFRVLDELDLSFGGDGFLEHMVEIAVLAKLRDVKYRSRISVEKGVTLYGIMDETGFLQEGEIYCTFDRPREKGKLEKIVLAGEGVVVTRSPAMHPGDVQKARAVGSLPADSPLRALTNVVVFSQKGQRDLPSQLSGGDLDGDLYNIIFDERLIPPAIHAAAEYKAVPPVDIGRPVTQRDITKFFVKFMETDQLGRISTIHMQLADRAPTGTLDSNCKKLSEMASTAVDFSKTGIPVDMSQCPRHDMIRPDFMAPGPHANVQRRGVDLTEAEHDDDDDDAIEALNPDFKSFRYYESNHVLGRLYRAIDEQKIFQDMHQNARNDHFPPGMDVMNQVWAYVLKETAGFQWEVYKPLAREIREIYESNLLDVMFDFSMHPRYPLSEIEVFGGNIIGKNSGSTNRRVRERTIDMNKRFERDTVFAVQRIIHGENNDPEEALPRSIACMAVGMTEQSKFQNTLGEPKSWKYMATAVCLQQVELFKEKYDPLWYDHVDY
ncbi:RNA-dependent RNA polymerase eukaryotic-type [Neofusicoccum parvum]|uniref:RNA-dependent RNA polymerase eukaryotic-type n=1 Tax=Neofusicoccum parvum TaxID=310453 RepID=A0ACB5SDU8_9PEZI|nr:RNA-dependent RNA polymerase eukaryotic-type [Neofusicoccum parvum]